MTAPARLRSEPLYAPIFANVRTQKARKFDTVVVERQIGSDVVRQCLVTTGSLRLLSDIHVTGRHRELSAAQRRERIFG